MEVCVVAYIATQGNPLLLEPLDLAVNGEELLDEGAAKVQKIHLEGLDPLDIELVRGSPCAQEIADDRGDLDPRGRLLATLDARLETDGRREALERGEVRVVTEGVDAPAPASRSGFGANELQAVNSGDVAVQFFHRPVDRSLAPQRRLGSGIDEEVDVLGKAVKQAPSLREAGTPLEDGPLAKRRGDRSQDLGDPVVLLDEGLRQPGVRRSRS